MNGFQWVSIIALVGWLILALGAVRAQRISARKGVIMILVWGAIFLAAAAVFGVLAG